MHLIRPWPLLTLFQAARLIDQYRAGVHLHHGSPCLCAAGLIVGVLAADSRIGTIDEGKAEVGDRPGHVALAADVVAVTVNYLSFKSIRIILKIRLDFFLNIEN